MLKARTTTCGAGDFEVGIFGFEGGFRALGLGLRADEGFRVFLGLFVRVGLLRDFSVFCWFEGFWRVMVEGCGVCWFYGFEGLWGLGRGV